MSFLPFSQAVDFNIFEGLECHGVPVYVISRGKVVVDHGKIDVVKGSGKFIPRKPWTDFVYSRVHQRDKVDQPQKVEREPYTGPVIDLSKK
ncbi:PREDICTED: dihydropyrimidinase-like [Amphimedon queenslandica]|uniref:Amidohydrolase-related domain-containing protein n=2 Tax=Amphimedon queenslandica TaxID=400682 RepID=A0AAN0K3B6_AMPQE|nr:PREDICTED: dihydropyrimidinase-like [Amphimedon queenslandica]|eukprot:XP_019864016.1 PREDICTED: dihydropyrimidinase-like [Amphimedon queenslandica]